MDKRNTMKKMLKLMSIAAALAFTATAAHAAGPREQTKTKKVMVQELTLDQFQQKIYNLSDANASSELKYLGDKPAIVDFYASWCGPCRMVAPILEELAAEYAGRIVVYKVNIEKEPDLSAAFGIRSIPSILFIPLSGKPQMLQGAMPKDAFKKAIKQYLLK